MNKELRAKVHAKYGGRCAYCGCALEFNKMQVDHFNAQLWDRLDGNKPDESIENLMPGL